MHICFCASQNFKLVSACMCLYYGCWQVLTYPILKSILGARVHSEPILGGQEMSQQNAKSQPSREVPASLAKAGWV